MGRGCLSKDGADITALRSLPCRRRRPWSGASQLGRTRRHPARWAFPGRWPLSPTLAVDPGLGSGSGSSAVSPRAEPHLCSRCCPAGAFCPGCYWLLEKKERGDPLPPFQLPQTSRSDACLPGQRGGHGAVCLDLSRLALAASGSCASSLSPGPQSQRQRCTWLFSCQPPESGLPASAGAPPTAVPLESGLHFQLSTWAPGCGRPSSPRNRGDCGWPSLLTVLGPSALTQAPLKPTPRPPPLPWSEWPAQIHSILSHRSPCFLVETLGPLRKGRPGPRTKLASRHLEKTRPLQDWAGCRPLLPPAPLLTASGEQTMCFSAQPHFRAEVQPRPPFLDEGDHRILSSVFVLRSCLGTRNKARGVKAGRERAICVCVSGSGWLPPLHLPRQLRGAYLCASSLGVSVA